MQLLECCWIKLPDLFGAKSRHVACEYICFWINLSWRWCNCQENASHEYIGNVRKHGSMCDWYIYNCTNHMLAGGTKDASFIAKIFEDHIEDLFSNPNNKTMYGSLKDTTDVFFFDGASNVQKAGDILCAKYPRAHCLHGAEHVISLFFSDISKIEPIKVRGNECGQYILVVYLVH